MFLKEIKDYIRNALCNWFAPGLVSSDMTLDDYGLLSEELEVPPAEKSPDVSLDGDGSPGLGTAPLFL